MLLKKNEQENGPLLKERMHCPSLRWRAGIQNARSEVKATPLKKFPSLSDGRERVL